MKGFPILLVLLPIATQAMAQDDRLRVMEDVIACQSLREPTSRLACFDRTTATLAEAKTSGQLIMLDRKTVIARKQQRFGLTTPTGDIFGGGVADDTTQVKQLDSKVVQISPAKIPGRFDIQLSNGSVWQTVDPLPYSPKPGAEVSVKVGALGSYRLSIAGIRSVLAKRIR